MSSEIWFRIKPGAKKENPDKVRKKNQEYIARELKDIEDGDPACEAWVQEEVGLTGYEAHGITPQAIPPIVKMCMDQDLYIWKTREELDGFIERLNDLGNTAFGKRTGRINVDDR